MIPASVAVLTVSDTRTLATDRSGATVVSELERAGHRIVARKILTDDQQLLQAQFAEWIADASVQVVVATGGTGITARDVTPEALAPLVTKGIPGFGELFRWLSLEEIGPASMQSRAQAALCSGTLVFLLPGSTGAVQLALDRLLVPQLDSRTKPCNFISLLPRV